MRKNLVILLLVIISVSLGIRLARYSLDDRRHRVSANNTDLQILTRMEHEVIEVYQNDDTALKNQIMAREYSAQYITCDSGAGQARESQNAPEQIISIDIKKMNAQTYGNTGVVFGNSLVRSKLLNEEIIYDEHFVDTFVKRDERWQLVASQHTRFRRKA